MPQSVDRRPVALLFDFGGTLDGAGLTWKTRAFRLYRAAGLAADPADFDPLFYAADDALVGTVPATLPLDETVRRLFAGISAGLGVTDRPLTERLADRFIQDARTSLRDSARVLAGLARRHRLGVVSNFYGNLGAVCAGAGLAPVLGVITDSSAVGWSKPDPRIFRHALDALGVSPRGRGVRGRLASSRHGGRAGAGHAARLAGRRRRAAGPAVLSGRPRHPLAR